MTSRQRTNGLVCGAITVTGCTMIVFADCFYSGRWYLCIPIATLYLWGFLGFIELDRENDRREKILRQHGIDERQSTV
jgi:hypothetical protein